MAAKTVTTALLNANGSIAVVYGDGSGNTFPDREALAADPGVAAVGSDEWMNSLLLARWLALNPALNDTAPIVGTTLEVNLASALHPVEFGG